MENVRLYPCLRVRILLVVVLLFLFPSTLHAHRMLIEEVEPGFIRVAYDNGTPAGGAYVTFFDAEGNSILEGKVDTQGEYVYASNVQAERIEASDGQGHLAVWRRGEKNFWAGIPLWQRAFFGVSLLLLLGALSSLLMKHRGQALLS